MGYAILCCTLILTSWDLLSRTNVVQGFNWGIPSSPNLLMVPYPKRKSPELSQYLLNSKYTRDEAMGARCSSNLIKH